MAVPTVVYAAPPPCAVTVRGAASSVWQPAAEDAESRLRQNPGDCASVEVVATGPDSARLLFATVHGQRAERDLHAPSELAPTIEALLVELPAPPSSAQREPAVIPPPPSKGAEDTPKVQAGSASSVGFVLGASVGPYFGGPRPAVSASVGAHAALLLAGWELGVQVAYRPSYSVLGSQTLNGDDATPLGLSSYGAGVLAGRRFSLGRTFMLRAGLGASVGYQHAEWRPEEGGAAREAERGQTLLGLHVGAVFPRAWKTHVITTLGFDVDPIHVGRTTLYADGAPELPYWGAGLSIGVEGEVL